MKNKKGLVYCLKDPFTNEVRYIGFTSNKMSRRFSQHKYTALKQLHRTSHSINWFRSCIRKGKLPTWEILEQDILLNNWAEREDYWMSQYSNLTNQREGGCGVIIDRKSTSIQRSANAKKIKIVQLTEDNELVKIWNSASDIQKSLGISRQVIARACKHKKYNGKYVYRAGGIRWAYYSDWLAGTLPPYMTKIATDTIKKLASQKKHSKQCFMYCVYTGKLLKVFSSCQEARKYCGFKHHSKVTSAITKKGIVDKLYYFSYIPTKEIPKPIVFKYKEHIYLSKVSLFKAIDIKMSKSLFYRNFELYRQKLNIKKITEFTEDIVQAIRKLIDKSYV